ncbi:hypothetical protein KCU78_g11195, partial [Aureobasidium melanogenum]
MNNPHAATGDTLERISRPAFSDMIVSVARHKTGFADSTFTYQFPLWNFSATQSGSQDHLRTWINPFVADTMKSTIQDRLDVSLTDMSVVWCMSGSGQVAVVNDKNSLCAAIMDHQYTGKRVVQLYVVKNSNMTDLPKHFFK